MYNNLTFLSNHVNKAQLLIHLTLWTFSVGSKIGEGLGSGLKSSLGQGGLGGCDPQPQAANIN